MKKLGLSVMSFALIVGCNGGSGGSSGRSSNGQESPATYTEYIYAATDQGLGVSSDGGQSWQNYTTAEGLPANNVRVVKVVGDKLYIGTASGGIAVTDKDFSSFEYFNNTDHGISNSVDDLCVFGDTIVSATYLHGSDVSHDGGQTWQRINTTQGLAGNGSNHISCDEVNIYISAPQGFAESANSLGTFYQNGTTFGDVRSVEILDSNRIMLATNLGIYVVDRGDFPTNDLFAAADGMDYSPTLDVVATSDGRWHAVTTNNFTGSYTYSDDEGATWSNVDSATGGMNALGGTNQLAVGEEYIAISTTLGLNVSNNGGMTFDFLTTTEGLPSNSLRGVTIHRWRD